MNMQKSLFKKGLLIGIIVLFIGFNFVSGLNIQLKNTTNPLINTRGYIQDLIDNASDGDTIYIPSGIYYENITINKSISLVGEDKNISIIDGDGCRHVVTIVSDWVNISGFTIQSVGNPNMGIGIQISSNHTAIIDNIISNNDAGIRFGSLSGDIITSNNIITGNTISNNDWCGICLFESSDNIITDNTVISNNYCGIDFSHSSDNNITGNTISNNGYGIDFSHSIGNIITDNIISNNDEGIILPSHIGNNIIKGNNISNNDRGIYFSSSSDNIITDNIILNNDEGIILSCSSNNDISSNSFFNSGILVFDSYDNNMENNTVNGKPLVYLEYESDKVIDYEVGQVILVNCDNIVAENLNLSNATVGIELWGTYNSSIQNNDCSNNYYGIYSFNSSRNNITCNNISSNDEYGIYLWYFSSNNIISGNNISYNGYGIYIEDSSGNNITGNTISNNNDGIYFVFSSGNTITANNISSNGYGIHLFYSSENIIIGNNILNNDWCGVILSYYSGNNIISDNWDDIYLSSSSNNVIYHNNFIGNTYNAYSDYGVGINIWDDGKYGNYWDDYKEKYPHARRLWRRGIWDTPYVIGGWDNDNKDNCPLIKQWSNSKSKTMIRNTSSDSYYLLRFLERFPLL
jgi:parallel beta-helix repeat protein